MFASKIDEGGTTPFDFLSMAVREAVIPVWLNNI
jgi:hypothetical protein